MARLWSSGFELNSTTAGMEWTALHSTAVIQSTTVRSGTYALQVTSLGSGTAKGIRYSFASAAGNGPYYFRIAFRAGTLPSAENRIIVLNNSADLTTPIVYLTLDNSGTLKLYDEDGQITGTSTLSTDTWYEIEIKIDVSAAAGSHIVEAKVDQASAFASASNRSLSAGVMSLSIGANLASEAQTTGNFYFDDIAINDSTGSFQTSYPGTGKILHLRPNAAGDNWDFIPPGSDYTDIDEVTPDDGTTEVSGGSTDEIIDVNVDATPAAIGATDVISVVQVGGRINGTTTGTDPNGVFRVKATASGTVEESADATWSNTSYLTNNPVAPQNYRLTLYNLPGASTDAWTKTTLDTAQIGFRMTNDPTSFLDVSALWLLVDHKAVSSATNTATFTVDGFVVGRNTATFTIDAIVKAVQSNTFTVDGIVKAIQTSTFTIDAIVKQIATTTFTVDGLVKAQQTSTLTIDGLIKAVQTNTLTIDGIVKSIQTLTFTVDGLVIQTTTSTFTVDALVFATLTLTFTVDGLVFATVTNTFTIDAIVKQVQTSTFTIDGIIKEISTPTFTIDAIIKAVQSSTFTVDGLVFATLTSTFTIEGIVFATTTKTFTIDAIVLADQNYTRESKASLPSNNTDLATAYSVSEYADVASDDTVYVQLSGQGPYLIHQFKKLNTNYALETVNILVNLQANTAPSSKNVLLQVYNQNSTSWETLDTNTTASANTDFDLLGSINASLSNYYDADYIVSFRVYQDIS